MWELAASELVVAARRVTMGPETAEFLADFPWFTPCFDQESVAHQLLTLKNVGLPRFQ